MELGISIHLYFYRSGEQNIKLKVGDIYSRCSIVSLNTLFCNIYKPSLTANVKFYKIILGWITHSKIRMTIVYSREVFNSGGTGLFLHLLNRWKGSIYKLVWRSLLVYVSIYATLSLLYRFQLSEEGKLVIKISFPFRFKREF